MISGLLIRYFQRVSTMYAHDMQCYTSKLVDMYAQIRQNAGCAPSLRMLIRCNVQVCVNVECNAVHNTFPTTKCRLPAECLRANLGFT